MAISGPGGIRPQGGEGSRRKADLPIQEHVELEAMTESLLHVVEALKSTPKDEVGVFYKARRNQLLKEQKALLRIQKLLTEKPHGWESKVHEFLHEGETIEHLEKVLPLEFHIVEEKLKAVETARILTEGPQSGA